jgi:hypothetical protein
MGHVAADVGVATTAARRGCGLHHELCLCLCPGAIHDQAQCADVRNGGAGAARVPALVPAVFEPGPAGPGPAAVPVPVPPVLA